MSEDVVVGCLDAIENTQPACNDKTKFPADPSLQAPCKRRPFAHQCACAFHFECKQCAPAIITQRLVDVVCADAKAFKVVLRDVDALLAPVDGNILPEIDQLKAAADAVGHP